METTQGPRPTPGRGRAAGRARRGADTRDEYDLLTAVLLGAAIGAGTALLFRRGPRGRRPAGNMIRVAGKGARHAGRYGLKGARWAGERAARGAARGAARAREEWDRIPFDEIGDAIGEYMASAREAIDDAVSDELKDLRKAIRRQRKRLGV